MLLCPAKTKMIYDMSIRPNRIDKHSKQEYTIILYHLPGKILFYFSSKTVFFIFYAILLSLLLVDSAGGREYLLIVSLLLSLLV